MELPEWYTLKFKGMRWQRFKQPARAIDCLTRAIDLMRQSSAPTLEIANTLNYLGFVYLNDGQLSPAEATLREALKLIDGLPSSQKDLAAEDLMLLAEVLSKQGRHQEALEAGMQGLKLHQSRDANSTFIREVKATVKQLRRNLAEANKRERQLLRMPSRSL